MQLASQGEQAVDDLREEYECARARMEESMPGNGNSMVTYAKAARVLRVVAGMKEFSVREYASKTTQLAKQRMQENLQEEEFISAVQLLASADKAASDALEWVERQKRALLDSEDGDLVEQKVQALAGMFRASGLSKAFSRKAQGLHASFAPTFRGDRFKFMQWLASKNVRPALTILNDPVWVSPKPTVTEESLKEYNRLWTPKDVADATARSKSGKATHSGVKMPAEAHKIAGYQIQMLMQRAVDARAAQSPTQEAALQDVLDMLERRGTAQHDFHAIKAMEWNFAEATGHMLPQDTSGYVALIFKGTVENRRYSEEEKEEIESDFSKWREVGKLTATRKEYASALAKATFEYSEANFLHRGIQLAYTPGYDAIRIFHLLKDMVFACVVNRPVKWLGRVTSFINIWGDLTSCFSGIIDEAREEFIVTQRVPDRRAAAFRALHRGSEMFMVMDDGTESQATQFKGAWQGCPGSNAEVHLTTNSLAQACYEANVGFVMDDGEIVRPQMFCDDFDAMVGGMDVPPTVALEWAYSLCNDILRPWTQTSNQYFKLAKCGCFAVYIDEYGQRVALDPDVQLVTEKGLARVQVFGPEDTVKTLGVYIQGTGQVDTTVSE